MSIITETAALAALCERLAAEPAVFVDTEFIRDRTYWPRLCLVQIAGSGEAMAIDPLAKGIDLAPLHALMSDPSVLKVFHAARQDLEIFYHLTGRVPGPLFDTQVAAMVCGFGDSVGYDKLVARFANAKIDKGTQYTDWARRPLSPRQLGYALDDVIHLRTIYGHLAKQLQASGRSRWLDEEMAILADPATYNLDPGQAWRRLRPRSRNAKYLGVLAALAAWREREAQRRDIPRNHLLKDEAIQELAAERPSRPQELARLRSVSRGTAEGPLGAQILEAVQRGLSLPPESVPRIEAPEVLPRGLGPLIDLLKVLLRMKCEEHDVAAKLVASSADLERIAAADDADVPALHGWRREIFGEDALALKHGRIALVANGKRIRAVKVADIGQQTPASRRGAATGG